MLHSICRATPPILTSSSPRPTRELRPQKLSVVDVLSVRSAWTQRFLAKNPVVFGAGSSSKMVRLLKDEGRLDVPDLLRPRFKRSNPTQRNWLTPCERSRGHQLHPH